jgi:hypothetical protein
MPALRLLVLAFVPSILAAQVSRWRPLSTDTASLHARFIDYETLADTPNGVSAWFREKGGGRGDTTVAGKRYSSAKYHYLVDCQSKQFAIIGDAFYDHDGNVLESFEVLPGNYQMNSPIPESVGEANIDAACFIMDYKKRNPSP